MRTRFRVAVAIVTAVLFSTPAAARADVVLTWNAIAVGVPAGNPFNQARVMAATQLAVFEAINAIQGGYEPYLGTVVAPAGASADAAVIAAAHKMLKHYVPGSGAMLDTARASSLAAIPDGASKDAGVAVGEAAAAAVIAARTNDVSSVPEFYAPTSTDPGEWQRTPSCPAEGGTSLHWVNLRPFGIANAADFVAGPPPALTSNEYAKNVNEVKRVGAKNSTERPQDRSDVARFYAGSSPAYVMNLAARQVAVAQGRSAIHSARALALINMAISDAAVASFATKYTYTLWRPETAIRNADLDGNSKTDADATWEPVHRRALLPGLYVEPRVPQRRRRRGLEASVRSRRPFHHDDESQPSRTRLRVFDVPRHHGRYRRRAGLRRHPFPLRSGRRGADRTRGRNGRLQREPAETERAAIGACREVRGAKPLG